MALYTVPPYRPSDEASVVWNEKQEYFLSQIEVKVAVLCHETKGLMMQQSRTTCGHQMGGCQI